MDIYVGNLPWSITDDGLKTIFATHGSVLSAKVVLDRETGRSRGFGFVAMPSAEQANAAIRALDGTPVEGRALRVREAEPRGARPPRSGPPPRGDRPSY